MTDEEGFGPAARGGRGRSGGQAGQDARGGGAVAAPARRRQEGGDFGPAQRGRARPVRRASGGVLRRLLKVLLVLVLVLLLYVGTLAVLALTGMGRIGVDGLASSRTGVMNVLLVGSDSREGLTDEERQELRTGSEDGLRTDTIMLLSTGGGRTAMLSFPRDLFVTRCDGSQGRINVAYRIGGASCLVETVGSLSGISIDHYLEVDFRGFVQIVDAVGGVEMLIDEPIADRRAGPPIDAGCQRLTGAQALAFVRTREGPTGDLGRVARQQRLLRELSAEVAEPTTLANPLRMVRTTRSTAAALTADRRLGPVDLVRLARGARGMASGRAQTHIVPGSPADVGGASVLMPEPAAEALFADFRSGAILGIDTDLEPADVELDVLNGAGVSGLAGRAGEELSGRGFTVVEIGNADAREQTTVRYGPGDEAAARTIAESIGGDVAREEAEGLTRPQLVLGQDAADGLASIAAGAPGDADEAETDAEGTTDDGDAPAADDGADAEADAGDGAADEDPEAVDC